MFVLSLSLSGPPPGTLSLSLALSVSFFLSMFTAGMKNFSKDVFGAYLDVWGANKTPSLNFSSCPCSPLRASCSPLRV